MGELAQLQGSREIDAIPFSGILDVFRSENHKLAAMRTRVDIHDAFVSRFHFGKRGEPVAHNQLDAIEEALGTKLPTAYCQFMLRHGVVYTPSILGEVADGKLGHPDIQEFLQPDQAIENTKMYWSGGMPDDVIGVASDCMGNMIGFHRQSLPSDDSPVVFFDHDFVDVYELSPSFDEFLAWYLDHLKGPQLTND
ncbi:MAG TPA: SMI1/KNR4 family protein [Planctomycetaceae bacterium]|nr:SMI1/KNR4 family protein [Planctomycetaceae bacterium]